MLAPSDINAEALRDHFSLPVLPEVIAKVEEKKGEISETVQADLSLSNHDFVLLMAPSNALKIWAQRLLS